MGGGDNSVGVLSGMRDQGGEAVGLIVAALGRRQPCGLRAAACSSPCLQLLAQLIEPVGAAQHRMGQTKRGPLGLILFGAPGRIRTYDPRFRRPVL